MPTIVKFGMVGAGFAVLDLMLLNVSVNVLGIAWQIASPFIMVTLTIVHYFIIKKVVFSSNPKNNIIGVLYSIIISLTGVLVNQLLLYTFLEIFGVGLMLSKLISIVVNFFLNYFLRKSFVFVH
jgi:putative flippase GtrA